MPLLVCLAGPAAADARDAILEALGAHGCAMTNAEGEAAFAAMGIPDDAVRAAARAMVEAGEAEVDGDRFRVLPPLCGTPPGDVSAEAAPDAPPDPAGALHDALAAEPGCRADLAVLSRSLGEAGFEPAALDAALGALVREGTLDASRGVGRLLDCGEAPQPAAGTATAAAATQAIQALGDPGLRGAIALEMPALGCRLPADAEAAKLLLTDRLVLRLGGGADFPRVARALLARRVAEVLDNPGPAYQTDAATGELVLLRCTP